MGDVKIGDNVSIISAGNTVEDRGNVYEMAKPLANRFIHATLSVPDVDSWIEWALRHGVDKRIIAYLKFKPDQLFNFMPDSPENAFPTPRSWAEYVNKMIKDIDYTNPMFQKYVAMAVGSGVAVEFTAFQRLKEKIDFKQILENPKTIRKIEQIDLQFSLIALVGDWFDKNADKKGCDKLFELISYMQPEFAILTLKYAKASHINELRKYAGQNPLWKNKLSHEYAKYLRE